MCRREMISMFWALLPLTLQATAEYGITNPASLNVSVGESAIFTCDFNFSLDYVTWFLNEIPVQQYIDLDIQEQMCLTCQPITSQVRIFVSPEAKAVLNNSPVQCLAINTDENIFKFSLPAQLMVQDVLEAPSNVTAAFIGNGILLRWVRPYTLSGVVIIGYHIQTTIVDGFTKDAIFPNDPTKTSNCHNYEICLRALTAAGLGGAACVNRGRNEVLGSLHDRLVKLAVFNQKLGSSPYDQAPYSCPIAQASELSIPVFPEAESDITNKSSLYTHFHNNVSLIFILSLPETANDTYITTTISLENITYHVVDIIITETEYGFYFHCVFAEHSTATGCMIKIECQNDITKSYKVNVTKETRSLLTSNHLKCSLVTVYSYDVITGSAKDVPSVIKKNITLDFKLLQQTYTPAPFAIQDPTIHVYSSSSPTPIESNKMSTETIGTKFVIMIILLGIDIIIFSLILLCTCILCTRLRVRHVSRAKERISKTVPEMYVHRHHPEVDEMCGIEIHMVKKSELVAISKELSHKKHVFSGETLL